MKRILKSILPTSIRQMAGRMVAKIRARKLGKLDVASAFDEIYRKGYWKQGSSLSGVGSEGEWLEKYCKLVKDLAVSLRLQTVVDAGCGDFNVGKELAPYFNRYTALDISRYIIEKNKSKYFHFPNVQFFVSDLIKEIPPRADIVLIRQVFQHLSNEQITHILANVKNSGSRYLLVSEEQPSGNFKPNLDLQSHSVLTRLDKGSAVDISAPPFSTKAALIDSFANSQESHNASVLSIYLIEFD